MSYYYNFCDPVIDIYTNHLYREPVIEDWGTIEKLVEYRANDVNRMGSNIHEFRRLVAEASQIYGHSFILVDKPNVDRPIVTLKDQIDNKAFPYFTLYHPQNVVNWALDKFGSPYWILICDYHDSKSDPFVETDCEVTKTFILWTREEWITFDEEYNETGRGNHGLGVVPIVCVYNKQSKKRRGFYGVSALADISFIARDVYNSCSELKQILRDQTFAFLALQGESTEYDELSVGTSKGLLYPQDRNPPQYVSPPAQNAQIYFEHIDRQIRKIYQLAKLEGGSAQQTQSAEAQSGTSKAWDFNETNAALASKASNLEDAEQKMWSMFARWEGKEFDGSIIYPKDFDIKSFETDLDESERLMRLSISGEFDKEVKKALIKKKFPRLPKDKEAQIIDEIEKYKPAGRLSLSGMLNRNANQSGNIGGINARN